MVRYYSCLRLAQATKLVPRRGLDGPTIRPPRELKVFDQVVRGFVRALDGSLLFMFALSASDKIGAEERT